MAWNDYVAVEHPRTNILGLDPGAGGALAFLDKESWELEIIDTPYIWTKTKDGKRRRIVNVRALSNIVLVRRPFLVSTEKVHAMPQMDVKSIFTFGRFYGQIEMMSCMANAEFFDTDPAVWKKQMGVNSDKDLSRDRAAKLFPCAAHLFTRKTDHDRAEAAMLALFGAFSKGLTPRNISLKEPEDDHPMV